MENKIGKFILELRTERNMTQNDLAELIPITRQAVSRWEQGKSIPDSSTLIILSEIFDVTINELLNGERNAKDAEQNIEKIALEMIDENISKEKKVKKITILSIVIVLGLILLFLLYYFFATYDSVKIYTIDGKNEKFMSNDGIMILTKQKIYFKLGMLEYDEEINIDKVKLFYKDSNKDVVIFEDDRTDKLVIDFYGYNEYVSNKNIDKLINNLYLEILFNDESSIIKFNVFLDMANNKFFFDKENIISEDSVDEEVMVINSENGYAESIRNVMIENGEKVDDGYVLNVNENIRFTLQNKNSFRLIINDKSEKEIWQYNLLNLNMFTYRKYKESQILKVIEVSDINNMTNSEKEKFNKFKNYINIYILEKSN